MIPLQIIREQPDWVIQRLAVKNFDANSLIYQILELDWKRKSTQFESDERSAEYRKLTQEIGSLIKAGQAGKANDRKNEVAKIKEEVRNLQERLDEISRQMNELLVRLPNIPDERVSPGISPADNEIVYSEGSIPQLPPEALCHWDLAVKYQIISFEIGSKVTGAGFPFYKDKGAKLQRSLISFFLDEATKAGYTEYEPPLLVNEDSAFATGQLPDKEGQMYFVPQDNFYLIPTAEVPLTNVYRNEFLKHTDFPIKLCAYSACFRREAGSYGKDVRGLNRLHQFDKVEIVQLSLPENSFQILEEMTEHVAHLLRKLELPFRKVKLCGGDMSFISALTYDFEVFSAAQQKWLEVSSVSNFTEFQANRMKLRFKDKNGKTRLAHTLNGSALALPRIMAALLENNQSSQGIHIPEALIPYTGFDSIP